MLSVDQRIDVGYVAAFKFYCTFVVMYCIILSKDVHCCSILCRPSGMAPEQFNALSFRCGRVLHDPGDVRRAVIGSIVSMV